MNLFMTMGTNPHDALIEQFTSIIPEASPEAARFFLEANAWSLQPALASFFDSGGSVAVHSQETPLYAEFVCDVTIGEGEEIPPGTEFAKTWRLRNNGESHWPHGCTLHYVQGERMGAPAYVPVPALAPGETADVSVDLCAPAAPGYYAASWRLSSPQQYFGEDIWVVITVAEGGLLPLTQKLHAASVTGTEKRVSFQDAFSWSQGRRRVEQGYTELPGDEDEQMAGAMEEEDPSKYFFTGGNSSQSSPQRSGGAGGFAHFNSPFKNQQGNASFQFTSPTSGAGGSSIPSFGSLASHRFGSNLQRNPADRKSVV